MKKALHVLISLGVLLIILRPLVGFLQADVCFEPGDLLTPEAVERGVYEEILESTVLAQGEADFKAQLGALLQEEYGIAESDVDIYLVFDETGELCRIAVYLSGAALLKDPHELAASLTARLGYQTEVR